MNVFLWLFCLMLFCAPMTQVARKDVGDMKLRQQMRGWRSVDGRTPTQAKKLSSRTWFANPQPNHEANSPAAMQVQPICLNTLLWLISFSLGQTMRAESRYAK